QGTTRAVRELKTFFGTADDRADLDLIWWMGKAHTAAAAANCFDKTIACQRVHDLHQMVVRKLIGARELADRTQAIVVQRKMYQHSERIIRISGKSHALLLCAKHMIPVF